MEGRETGILAISVVISLFVGRDSADVVPVLVSDWAVLFFGGYEINADVTFSFLRIWQSIFRKSGMLLTNLVKMLFCKRAIFQLHYYWHWSCKLGNMTCQSVWPLAWEVLCIHFFLFLKVTSYWWFITCQFLTKLLLFNYLCNVWLE